jgi:cell division protein FtsB
MARRKKHYTAVEREPEFSRENPRRSLFARITGLMMAIFILVLASAIVVPIAPEWQKLRQVEAEYAEEKEREELLLKKRRRYELESEMISTNLDYLESRARDIGPFYRPGEQVIQLLE